MTERELFIQLCIANTESANFDVLQAAAAKILEQADKRYPEADVREVSSILWSMPSIQDSQEEDWGKLG